MLPSRRKASTYHSEIFKRPSSLNVLQCLLQILQLRLHQPLGLLSPLDSSSLEALNRLNLPRQVHLFHLEAADCLFDLGDDGLVLEDGTVVGEVDVLGLLLEDLEAAARIIVALLKSGEGVEGAAAETEGGGEFAPVDLAGGVGSLREERWLVGSIVDLVETDR